MMKDGCHLLWWEGESLGGVAIETRVSAGKEVFRRSTEKEVQVRMLPLKMQEVSQAYGGCFWGQWTTGLQRGSC